MTKGKTNKLKLHYIYIKCDIYIYNMKGGTWWSIVTMKNLTKSH